MFHDIWTRAAGQLRRKIFLTRSGDMSHLPEKIFFHRLCLKRPMLMIIPAYIDDAGREGDPSVAKPGKEDSPKTRMKIQHDIDHADGGHCDESQAYFAPRAGKSR